MSTTLEKPKKRRASTNARREAMAVYAFLVPNFLGFIIFTAAPVMFSFIMAFTCWNIFKKPVWLGLDNFRDLLFFHHEGGQLVANDPFFWQYFYNTVFMMVGIPLCLAGSLIIALMVNQKIRGVVFFRTILFLPTILSGVALLLLWKFIYNNEVGLINQGLRWLGSVVYSSPLLAIPFTIVMAIVLGAVLVGAVCAVVGAIMWLSGKVGLPWPDGAYRGVAVAAGVAVYALIGFYGRSVFDGLNAFLCIPPDWLGTVQWAKPSLVLMGLWGGIGGMNMILYLAAMQGVPVSLYEAVELDGAGAWSKFWTVTWPMISPTTFYIMIMSVIGSMQGGFMNARIMTNGGPVGSTTTIEYYLYITAFQNFNMGYASAISWFLFAVVFVLTMLVWRAGKKMVIYE